MSHKPLHLAEGPFRAEQLRCGDPYELANGHAVKCLPSGGWRGMANLTGGTALKTDPAVESAGFDVGYAPDAKNLRAPDIAVGNVPDRPGWVRGVPPLAVEYADTGQDEGELQEKIAYLLSAGTKYIWVVRMTGPRRVEVYEPRKARRTVLPGEQLDALGVLKNPLPVEALYDPAVSDQTALRNLLQRHGYADLDEVRDEGRVEGHAEGRAEGLEVGRAKGRVEGAAAVVLRLLKQRLNSLSEDNQQRIYRLSSEQLESLGEALLDFQTKDDLAGWLERHGG